MDPDSYKGAKLGASDGGDSPGPDVDDAAEGRPRDGEGGESGDGAKEWDYIRVDGLGFVPGLCCPHHDRVQSNGVLRATDFDDMMLRHPTEVGRPRPFVRRARFASAPFFSSYPYRDIHDARACSPSFFSIVPSRCALPRRVSSRVRVAGTSSLQVGICIDHNAAFVIDGSSYRVLRPTSEDLPGSVADDGSFSGDRLGRPGVWIKEVLGCGTALAARPCPDRGAISGLLRVPEAIAPSARNMKLAATSNPDDGPLRASYPGFAAKSYFGGSVAGGFLDALAESDDGGSEDGGGAGEEGKEASGGAGTAEGAAHGVVAAAAHGLAAAAAAAAAAVRRYRHGGSSSLEN